MKHEKKTLSIRIPMDVVEPLEAEASEEERSINQQLTVILRDRYKAHSHAPPTVPTRKTAQATVNNRTGRKTSAT